MKSIYTDTYYQLEETLHVIREQMIKLVELKADLKHNVPETLTLVELDKLETAIKSIKMHDKDEFMLLNMVDQIRDLAKQRLSPLEN